MMDTATAVMLSTYNGWADDVLFAAMGRLPREHLYRPTKTLFGSMIGTLNHNYQVDVVPGEPTFSARGAGFSNRREVLHPEFEDLVTAQTEMNRWFIDWAQQQSPSLTVGRLQSSIRSRSTLMGSAEQPPIIERSQLERCIRRVWSFFVSYRFAITSLPSQLIRLALNAIMPPEPACDYTYSPSP